MTTFYVGQRVRVNCPESEAHGQETFVTRINANGIHLGRKFIGCEVGIDNDTSPNPLCIFELHELEPIQHRPDKQQLEEYEKDIQDLVSTSLSVIAEGVREHV